LFSDIAYEELLVWDQRIERPATNLRASRRRFSSGESSPAWRLTLDEVGPLAFIMCASSMCRLPFEIDRSTPYNSSKST
jgi:hypothetical protein